MSKIRRAEVPRVGLRLVEKAATEKAAENCTITVSAILLSNATYVDSFVFGFCLTLCFLHFLFSFLDHCSALARVIWAATHTAVAIRMVEATRMGLVQAHRITATTFSTTMMSKVVVWLTAKCAVTNPVPVAKVANLLASNVATMDTRTEATRTGLLLLLQAHRPLRVSPLTWIANVDRRRYVNILLAADLVDPPLAADLDLLLAVDRLAPVTVDTNPVTWSVFLAM